MKRIPLALLGLLLAGLLPACSGRFSKTVIKSRGIPTFVLISPQGVVQDIREGFSERWLLELGGSNNQKQ